MAKNEMKRIELLKKARSDENKISVGTCVDIFTSTLSGVHKHTNTMKIIEQKLGKETYAKLLTCLANSFISTLYINGAENEAEMRERYKYVSEVNEDVISYSEIIEEGGA